MKVKIAELDIIYLSYDEPNADKNYADLLTKIPWAKRVHGVEGSDAAHKACAKIAETDRFITIDGDNQIDEQFLNQTKAVFVLNKETCRHYLLVKDLSGNNKNHFKKYLSAIEDHFYKYEDK